MQAADAVPAGHAALGEADDAQAADAARHDETLDPGVGFEDV